MGRGRSHPIPAGTANSMGPMRIGKSYVGYCDPLGGSTQRSAEPVREIISGVAMTDEIAFGTLEDVHIRKAWAHEAHGFTPWLAENLDRLSEAIGREAE